MQAINGGSSVRRSPETCHWAISPAPPQWPAWVDAAKAKWQCRRDDTVDRYVMTGDCTDCNGWRARSTSPEDPRR